MRPAKDSDEEQPFSDRGFRANDDRKLYGTINEAVDDLLNGGLLSGDESTPPPHGRSRRERNVAEATAVRATPAVDEIDEDSDGGPGEAPGDPDDEESDEAAAEPDVDEESDEDQPSDQPEEDEDEAQPATRERIPEGFEVELSPGGERVTLKELKAGFLRNKDYTTKTQEVAEVRKQAHASRQQSDQVRTEYASKLDLLNRALFSVYEERPPQYWEQLRSQDVTRYMLEKDVEREQREKMTAIIEEHKAEVQRFHDEALRRHQERLGEAKKELVKTVPAWSNPERMRAGTQKLRGRAQELYGFQDSDLDGIVDHRVILVLRDAIRYRDAVAKGAPSSQRSAAPSTPVVTRPVPYQGGQRSSVRSKSALKKHTNSQGHFKNPEAAVSYLLERDRRHEE